MKLVIFSDLHLEPHHKHQANKLKLDWMRDEILRADPDVVIIAGDVTESDERFNVYKFLHMACQGYKTIFCLGNHEFMGFTTEQVLNKYRAQYNPGRYDVHCLDVVGRVTVDGIRFLGNVLWYDGSMAFWRDQDLYDWGTWADKHIIDFDYKKEHTKCMRQIESNYDDAGVQFLVTHTCPHSDLNLHMREMSPFNAYSGVTWLLEHYKFEYAVCGHTHLRDIGRTINGCLCANIGAANYPPYQNLVLEI